MEAWCVVVPKDRGEALRLILLDRGVLLNRLRVQRSKDHLLIPVAEPVDVGYPVERRVFPERVLPARSYKDLVEVPERLRTLLPTSFDVIGDIALLKIPEELRDHRDAIGRAILAWNRKLRVVAQDHGVKGDRRVRAVEVLAGERRTVTTHVEFGLRYRVDVARAYFSPRLGTERKRVADAVGRGERVLDPFAGVGPYAVLIAKTREPSRVVASDANPDAVAFLRANVATNRADRVDVREGEAKTVLRDAGPADRIILDLPHSAFEFLPDALRALRSGGTVHAYGIVEHAEREDRVREIRYLAEREDRAVDEIRLHSVRGYSATQHHVAFDVRVGPT
jgi:tRNA (guanine37-N1)-methyltransferase